MEELSDYRVLVGDLNLPLGRGKCKREYNIKWILRKKYDRVWSRLIWVRI
jgi:hypothetical protein